MISLRERIRLLEADLQVRPPRINVYHDLPFAILRYEPEKEWEVRREARLLANRLKGAGWTTHLISLADLLWEGIDRSEGMEAVVELERSRGFGAAQDQVTTYLSDPDWAPLPDLLATRLSALDPAKDVAFLLRAGAMAPSMYQMSRLLDEMQGRTRVTSILFYPSSQDATSGLQFMDLEHRQALGNYRVKIYG